MLLMAWTLLWPLSIFSKESGILFPGFVAAYELILRRHAFGGLDGFGRSNPRSGRRDHRGVLYLSVDAICALAVVRV